MTNPFDPRQYLGKVDMRGTLALDEAGQLGIIFSHAKVMRPAQGCPAYYGIDVLTGKTWRCASPTRTAGSVKQWLDSQEPLNTWLEKHGCDDAVYGDDIGAFIVDVARSEDMLS